MPLFFALEIAPSTAVRFHLLIGAALADEQLFHQADLVGVRADREILLVAEFVDAAAQDADAERVEGADGHLVGGLFADHAADAFAHFAGGLVGEGDGEDFGGRDLLFQHVGDPAGDGAGFAGARAGEDHDGAVERGHGLALGLVEGVE